MLFDAGLARKSEDEGPLDRLCKEPGQSVDLLRRRFAVSRPVVHATRNLLTYSSYLERSDQSAYYRRRWEQYLPAPVRWSLPLPGVRRALARDAVRQALRRFELRVRPAPSVLRHLSQLAPDVVIASPLNYWGSEEVEYVKAARALGIPTAHHVFSWDNLTTKSLLYVEPDLVLVWNQRQAREAVEIHGVEPERIVVTGAPHFDDFIADLMRPVPRAEFCARAGLDPARAFVAYLGSSSFIAADETWLVRELVGALGRHPAREIRELQILLRPHPAHARIYDGLEDARVRIWPKGGARFESSEFTRDYVDTLQHAMAAFGINTSGLLNAVIADRPCLTLLSPRYRETQAEAAHFGHLLESNVLETCSSADDCARALDRIRGGIDGRAGARAAFLDGWIRPRGRSRAAGDLAAAAIVELARGRAPSEIDVLLGLEGAPSPGMQDRPSPQRSAERG